MTFKQKYITVLIALVLGILCLASCKKKLPDPPPHMDMTLTVEMAHRQEVIDAFLLESEEPVVYEDPQTLGLPYVPEGARCYDICSLNERTVYISYQWNGVDYIVAYYGTTVEKCARVVDENDEYWQYVYKIDSENNVVECTDIEEITVYGWQWWKR